MFEKLQAVEERYEELTKLIADSEIIANQAEWQKLVKEHASIEDVVLKFREYKKVRGTRIVTGYRNEGISRSRILRGKRKFT